MFYNASKSSLVRAAQCVKGERGIMAPNPASRRDTAFISFDFISFDLICPLKCDCTVHYVRIYLE